MQAAACGELHTALLTAAGEVFTFGVGEFGVLGHGTEDRAVLPKRVEALVGEAIVAVSCGWRHTAALSAHAHLYTWGHGGAGQLGHGGTIHFFLPLRLHPHAATSASPPAAASTPAAVVAAAAAAAAAYPAATATAVAAAAAAAAAAPPPPKWVQVSCGARHTAALAEDALAHTWGDGEHGQLGHGEEAVRRPHPAPQLVEGLRGVRMQQIECGTHHTAAVTAGGQLYSWGSGGFGQLGHGTKQGESVPRAVAALRQLRVVRVACGSHTLALTAQGELYSWGHGVQGQLGHGGTTSEAAPRRVEALRHTRVVGLAGGQFHSLALAEDDAVYTWGSASHGELGHPATAHQPTPRALAAVRGRRLLFAACGGTHTALLLGGRRHDRDRDVAEGGATSDETS